MKQPCNRAQTKGCIIEKADAFLKFRRNSQEKASTIAPAKGELEEKGRIFTILWDEAIAFHDRAKQNGNLLP